MNTWIQIAFLGCICFFSFFIHLDAHDVDLMEARNFITAREIVANGTWLVPTMNGEIRINKPPLPTWITAVARIAGGDVDNNLIMRLPAAMMASMLVFSLWGFMRTLSEDRLLPFMTAAILATSLLIINKGRRGTWDIYCHSFMLTAIWVLSHGWNKKESAFGIFALAGTLLAFSFMSKGPVSFYALLLPFFIGYVYGFGIKKVTRKWRELLLALMIMGLISCIWPAFIYFKHPELSAVIAKYEISSWTSRHVEPFYFYFSFPLYTGIWAVFVIAGFVKPYASKKIGNFGSYRFILSWVILSLLLLSIIPEKKTRYLLPAMIPMAVMVGYLIRSLVQTYEKRQSSRGDDRLVIMYTIISCIIVLSMPVIMYLYGVNKGLLTPISAIGLSVVFIVLAKMIFNFGKNKEIVELFIASIALVCLINLTLLPILYLSPLYRKNPDFRSLREARKIKEIKGLNFYHIGNINPKSVWDLGKVVKTLDDKTGHLPTDELPIVMLSDFDPRLEIPAYYLERVELKILDKYRYDSKNPDRIKYLAIISPKKEVSE